MSAFNTALGVLSIAFGQSTARTKGCPTTLEFREDRATLVPVADIEPLLSERSRHVELLGLM
ncbi:hypothetical protein GCM10027417_11560 [Glutamicibacter endophyticus]